MAEPSDAKVVLSAFRLGWALAEVRGRNRPGGQVGNLVRMPDHDAHALPLRLERSRSELRIEAQAVVLALSKDLGVDSTDKVKSYGETLDAQAKLLFKAGAPTAVDRLARGRRELARAAASQDKGTDSLPTLEQVAYDWEDTISPQRSSGATVDTGDPKTSLSTSQPASTDKSPESTPVKKMTAGQQAGLAAMQAAADGLRQAIATDPATAAQAGIALADAGLEAIDRVTEAAWDRLAELIWGIDAHIQDQLTATSETQGNAYQLGRALAETYWALDPAQDGTSQGWHFLLGDQRCPEIKRLVGRLGAYMGDFTAPAIVGSVEIWQEVARSDTWHADRQRASERLYAQIRRWYELIILGQDPTTLIRPYDLMKGYRTVVRAVKCFRVQLATAVVGLAALVSLLLLLSVGAGSTWQKTLAAMLAAGGFSLAGVTGSIKNSAQAALKRLRQDAYTELVALAVQTAPDPPKGIKLTEIINRRKLTPPTPQ